jgi:hypothetical protein
MYLFSKKLQLSSAPNVPTRDHALPPAPTSAPVDRLAAAGATDRSAQSSAGSTPSSSVGPTPGASPRPTPPPTGVATPMRGPGAHKPPPHHHLLDRVWQLMGEPPNSAEQISSCD